MWADLPAYADVYRRPYEPVSGIAMGVPKTLPASKPAHVNLFLAILFTLESVTVERLNVFIFRILYRSFVFLPRICKHLGANMAEFSVRVAKLNYYGHCRGGKLSLLGSKNGILRQERRNRWQ